MSFAAGIGAGMGAGIGTGIAIGMSSGKKRACEEMREHFHVNGLTVHTTLARRWISKKFSLE